MRGDSFVLLYLGFVFIQHLNAKIRKLNGLTCFY